MKDRFLQPSRFLMPQSFDYIRKKQPKRKSFGLFWGYKKVMLHTSFPLCGNCFHIWQFYPFPPHPCLSSLQACSPQVCACVW